MDIDIGKIDRIKIWHDNSGPGSAWFLDSVIIRKKYSTCYTISNIYVQRLEQISQVLYRQTWELMNKNSMVRESAVNEDERRLNEYNGSKDRLGNSRGILRSPIMYDKVNLQKKVTWDEQSIGSQDDLLSLNSERSMTKTEQHPKKEGSFSREIDHMDHQVYWISSHNYINNQWQIESIEEISSFHLDQSTRSLLLSDRSTRHHQNKTSIDANEDEIYACQANRWLAKDKEDGKLEVNLSAKLIHQSSIDSKKKHHILSDIRIDSQSQKYNDERGSFKETKRSLSHDLRSSSSRSNIALKQQEESPKINSSLIQQSKSSHHIHDLTDSMSSERELLARLTAGSAYPSRTSIGPSISSSQRLKSSPNIDQQDSLVRTTPGEHLHHPPLPARLSSPRRIHDLTTPAIRERQSLIRSSDALPNYPQLSSDHNLKSSRSNKDLSISSLNSRESSVKNLREPSNNFRSIDTPTSSRVQPLKSPRNTKNLINPLTSEQELLARITGNPSHQSSSPATSLTSLSQHARVSRNTNDLIHSSMNDRPTLERIPPTPSFSSNQPSKAIRSSNESLNSLTRSPSAARSSHSKLSPQKSIHGKMNSYILSN